MLAQRLSKLIWRGHVKKQATRAGHIAETQPVGDSSERTVKKSCLIYGAATADMAATELDTFEAKWALKYASIASAWQCAWQEMIPSDQF